MLVRKWRKENPHTLLVGMLTGTAIMEIPPETKNRTMILFSNCISGSISKENESTDLKRVHEIINPYVK